MNILLVGSGGREHALAWRLRQSRQLSKLWVAGGNSGTAQLAVNLPINPEDTAAVATAAQSLPVDLAVIGPEQPLAAGIVDQLDDLGIPAFGPTQAAAQLEVSKSFAREVMQAAAVPGPQFHTFTEQQSALDFLSRHRQPVVVKADGLAAGKGVTLCPDPATAAAAVRACMDDRIFGPAGDTVVLEELLHGPEVSVFAFSDGENLSQLVAACDYKAVADDDQGPNTGGMGCFTPPPFWTAELAAAIRDTIMQPVITELAHRGAPYRGILYAGLMLTAHGPQVLEFNCRFGDPEAQVILPLLETDPITVMTACLDGTLNQTPVHWASQSYVAVAMVSGSYPGNYATGFPITGLIDPDSDTDNDTAVAPDTLVFHAGAQLADSPAGRPTVVTAGGRVLTAVGRGDSLAQARANAYRRVEAIHFEDAHYRRDIADLTASRWEII